MTHSLKCPVKFANDGDQLITLHNSVRIPYFHNTNPKMIITRCNEYIFIINVICVWIFLYDCDVVLAVWPMENEVSIITSFCRFIFAR